MRAQERDSAATPRPVRLMERSIFSDRMVFVRAVRESGWMGDVELVSKGAGRHLGVWVDGPMDGWMPVWLFESVAD